MTEGRNARRGPSALVILIGAGVFCLVFVGLGVAGCLRFVHLRHQAQRLSTVASELTAQKAAVINDVKHVRALKAKIKRLEWDVEGRRTR